MEKKKKNKQKNPKWNERNINTNFTTDTTLQLKSYKNLRKQQKTYMILGLVMSSNTKKKPIYKFF